MCPSLWRLFLRGRTSASGHEPAQPLGVFATATGIVQQLLLADGSHGKMSGGGMSQDEAAGAGMRLHGAVLGERDVERGEIKHTVEQEVEALVGQRGISHGLAAPLYFS